MEINNSLPLSAFPFWKRLIVALDTDSVEQAVEWVERLAPFGCAFKIGAGLVLTQGLPVLERLRTAGAERLFLDLKFHDIPHAVGLAVRTAAQHGVWMLTLHLLGGAAMLQAAREAVAGFSSPPLLIGVTVLTSLDRNALQQVGIPRAPQTQVLRLAELARQSGLDGVVASPKELRALRRRFGPEWLLVTPGIRLPNAPTDDQQRIATPDQALRDGADYLVMGRSLLGAMVGPHRIKLN